MSTYWITVDIELFEFQELLNLYSTCKSGIDIALNSSLFKQRIIVEYERRELILRFKKD
jgi:hypothetical protein